MAVTDTWNDWSTSAGNNSPTDTMTIEMDDELRNVKAEVKANAVALSGNQTISGVKTFTSVPLISDVADPPNDGAVRRAYLEANYVPKDAGGKIDPSYLGTGASGTKFLRGDQTYQEISYDLVVLRHIENAGTHGGGQTLGSWDTRTLNTEATDTAGICTLANNQFTLAAGTYDINAHACYAAAGYGRIRLYNVSDAVVQQDVGGYDLCSMTVSTTGSPFTQSVATLTGRFTLAAAKTLAIQSRVSYSNTTHGWGAASNFGDIEVYMEVVLRRVQS